MHLVWGMNTVALLTSQAVEILFYNFTWLHNSRQRKERSIIMSWTKV